jgi:LysR family transcriptional regulator, transcriptional activator of nhaA
MKHINYKHLYYFWVVAKEGGFSRAAERMDMAIQTISVQVRELEKSLGFQLLKPQGRGVTLTEAGQAAYARAEEIFQIGQHIASEVSAAAAGQGVRLAVGLSDGISKLAAHRLLAPLLHAPGLKLLCHEGEFGQLIAELALHHLDIVLADQPAPHNPNLRMSGQLLSSAAVAWFGQSSQVNKADIAQFPDSLTRLPVLLPTQHSPLRAALDRWFDAKGIEPHVVGEFEDSAMMAVFGLGGMGVFPASLTGQEDLAMMKGLKRLGVCDAKENIYAIYTRRGRHHPLVGQIIGKPLA